MKSDSFRNNRKALAALLLCSSFITGCPLAVMAEGNETNLEVVQQQIKVSGVVKDAVPAFRRKEPQTELLLILMVISRFPLIRVPRLLSLILVLKLKKFRLWQGKYWMLP